MVSGLGRDDWAPVHRFCTTLGLPCLLPNVDLPGSDQESAHNFYLSSGVLLDSAALARHLTDSELRAPVRRVVQFSAASGAGAIAARHLHELLGAAGIGVEDRFFAAGAERRRATPAPFEGIGPDDTLVL